MNYVDIWNQVKASLKAKNSENKLLQTWFEPTQLLGVEEHEGRRRFQLGVSTELHKYWISENLYDRLCAEVSAVLQGPFDIELVVTGHELPVAPENPEALELVLTSKEPSFRPHDPPRNPLGNPSSSDEGGPRRDYLNGEQTFSTFVVGRPNEFAHAACFAIAENPGAEGYNPLFICGPTGMGKTHLLNAVGNHVREKHPSLRIGFVSAERFLNECIASIRRSEMDKFRLRYRERCDILLIDDIQLLGRGESVQEELFNTLNDFFQKGRQVVVASDRMPKDIQGLEDRIRTRLEWGLIADIQMPDLETRVAILRYKAERKALKIPDEVINYVARISKRSIRELEGNLNKIRMFSELQGLAIDAALAKKVLASHDEPTNLTVEEVQRLTADHYGLKLPEIKSNSRSKHLVTARQVAMYLIKKHLDKSLVDIGKAFGGKDHTTVINALRKIENQHHKNADLKRDINDIENRIHNLTGV